MKIQVITDVEDAGWLMSRIAEDVERSLIRAKLDVKKSEHSCEINAIFQVIGDIANHPAVQGAISGALTFLLGSIRKELIRDAKTN